VLEPIPVKREAGTEDEIEKRKIDEIRGCLMKSCKFLVLIILLVLSLPFMYGGCVIVYSSGDLNSDEDLNKDETSGGFTGSTAQAAITQMNVEALAASAFAGGLTSGATNSLSLKQRSNADPMDVFRPLRFPLVLGDSLRRIDLGAPLITFGQPTVTTERNNFDGRCGGEVKSIITLNRISGKFSGNLLFSDYCDDGVIISGQTDVDGTVDVFSGDFSAADFTFDDLSDGSHSLEGQISMDFSATPIVATFSAYSKDEQTGKVSWIKDFSLNLAELIGHLEIEIFGTFYHPDHGFVSLTTTETFVVHEEDDWPTSGQLVLAGDNATEARLMAIDQLRCRVEADTDGDGIFDWESDTLNWNDL
jgi:hypothetical protein